jgi:hypothetical protein
VLATVGVLKSERLTRRGRAAVWLSFWLGIAVSLAANLAAAPTLSWPPVALLLAVELLAHGPRSRPHAETEHAVSETGTAASTAVRDSETENESDGEAAQVITLADLSPHERSSAEPTAQEVMWAHFRREQARGRTPTGAELDRVTGRNNYGRTEGRVPSADQDQRGVWDDRSTAGRLAGSGRHHLSTSCVGAVGAVLRLPGGRRLRRRRRADQLHEYGDATSASTTPPACSPWPGTS